MNRTIYLAGPMSGLDYHELYAQRSFIVSDLTAAGYQVLNPLRGKADLRGTGPICPLAGTKDLSPHAIFSRDTNDVLRADIVLADLRFAKKVSIGTVAELAIAWYNMKYVVVVMEAGGVHEHLFVNEMASIRFTSISEAVNYLTKENA